MRLSNLVEKTYKSYDRLSRYSTVPYFYNTQVDKYLYGTTQHLRADTPSMEYTVKRNDTYDSIALEFYNNPTYYWVICSFNRIRDPFSKPVVGTILQIPTMSAIEFE